MSQLSVTLGVLILLFSVSAGFIVLARYFFPSTDKLIPDDWKHWLTFRHVSYSVLVGSILLWLGTR